ncbi:30S ribosomal protein S20 [Candidatus Kuenenbacteria bacterium HGW-Kuenenbacteria-1]|uniref:Small ribosomal subunit protein bS20 n=1 Tax=Candidatus Kuenenbacteria bacterium HGW-Kuenenbacteria-1 TaxID=2013812 RepID=A0A2N1UNC5_9BACT|nr:MAG: 30S ribosomal protein S20 [Candidatus Kuenenbacteria bacterium HGW-Kuenenbacteria-1]
MHFFIMPIKKSALKALRQSKKRQLRNQKCKKNLKDLIKKTQKVVFASKKEEAQKLVIETQKAFDKAVQKKVIKKNTAARKKSRIMKKFNALVVPKNN